VVRASHLTRSYPQVVQTTWVRLFATRHEQHTHIAPAITTEVDSRRHMAISRLRILGRRSETRRIHLTVSDPSDQIRLPGDVDSAFVRGTLQRTGPRTGREFPAQEPRRTLHPRGRCHAHLHNEGAS
jgi:hypothetical protein